MFAKPLYLATIVAAALAATVSAAAQSKRAAIASAQNGREISLPADSRQIRFVLRQDLFDRNDPNNLRSDYPTPPAQPGAVR
jgi:hypothetical protein